MDKIISEFKVSETDDGFRIEIKGNKEALRRMLGGFGFCDSSKSSASSGGSFHPCSDFWSGFAGWCGSWEKTKEKSTSA